MNIEEFISRSTLLDDRYMTIFFKDDLVFTQFVLQIILDKEDLIVEKISIQFSYKSIGNNKSPILDVLAIDSKNRKYNIEIQSSSEGANPKRARYYSSVIDVNSLKAGEKFNDLPDTYVIFFCTHDYLKKGSPIYLIKRMIYNIDEDFFDGNYIVYVNGDYKGNDKLGHLIHDFKASNPDDIYDEYIKNKSKQIKQNKEESDNMSELYEEIKRDIVIEDVKKLMQNTKLTLEEAIQALNADKYKTQIINPLKEDNK